jgi:hypothetical protein
MRERQRRAKETDGHMAGEGSRVTLLHRDLQDRLRTDKPKREVREGNRMRPEGVAV